VYMCACVCVCVCVCERYMCVCTRVHACAHWFVCTNEFLFTANIFSHLTDGEDQLSYMSLHALKKMYNFRHILCIC